MTSDEFNTAEFMADLLRLGMRQDQIVEKGYEYALALLRGHEMQGSPLHASIMRKAVTMVMDVLPAAFASCGEQYARTLVKVERH